MEFFYIQLQTIAIQGESYDAKFIGHQPYRAAQETGT